MSRVAVGRIGVLRRILRRGGVGWHMSGIEWRRKRTGGGASGNIYGGTVAKEEPVGAYIGGQVVAWSGGKGSIGLLMDEDERDVDWRIAYQCSKLLLHLTPSSG